MARRRCKSKTKAGRQCRAAPLKGRDVCLAHSDGETRSSMQFVGGQPGSGRPRKPRVTDEMRRLVEEHAHAILSPYFASLGLELHDDGSMTRCRAAVIIAKHEGEVFASEVDDLGAQ